MVKKGFSLIELSVVLLIIGIIIAGITQSSRLVAQFKISSAQSQTKNSPINSIPDLAAWYETTREESFADSQTSDLSAITTWYDTNPSSNDKHNVISNSPPTTSPTYIASCINQLPCLRFNGISNYLSFGDVGGNFLTNTSYTIFIVEQRRSSSQGYFFGASYGIYAENDRIMLGYLNNDTLFYSHDLNGYTKSIAPYSTPSPKIHSFRFNAEAAANSRTYFANGTQATLDNYDANPAIAPITRNRFASIGFSSISGLNGYFNGDIAEIIIFTRALNNDEKKAVEGYLGKKWAIVIS